MLVNPGGPGGSGLDLFGPRRVRARQAPAAAYDWIGFDPRGVGSSEAALSCIPDYFGYDRPELRADDAADRAGLARPLRELRRRPAGPQRGRAAGEPDDAGHRPRHGQHPAGAGRSSRSTSTASPTAPTSARSTPRCSLTRVRRMVFDANVDPRKIWYQANLDQDVAFDAQHQDLLRLDRPATDDVYRPGPRPAQAVEKLYYAEQDELDAEPGGRRHRPVRVERHLPLGRATTVFWLGGDRQRVRRLGPQPATGGRSRTLYDAAVGRRRRQRLRGLPGGRSAPTPTGRRSWSTGGAATTGGSTPTARSSPGPTPGSTRPACPGRRRPSTPVNVDGAHGARAACCISETLDAATPFPGSLEVRRPLPGLEPDRRPAAARPTPAPCPVTPCVDDQIAAYLADGTLPARMPGRRPDVICAAAAPAGARGPGRVGQRRQRSRRGRPRSCYPGSTPAPAEAAGPVRAAG